MFKELLLETMRDTYLDLFEKNKNSFLMTRIVIALGLGVLGFLFTFDFSTTIQIVTAIVLAFGGFKLPYYQLLVTKSNEDVLKTFIFPQFLRFFIGLYATQGNVYLTLQATSQYVDEPLYTELMNFIDDIGEENDYARYVEFADFVGTTDAQLVMAMIYNFSEKGAVQEELDELERASKKILENKFEEAVLYKGGKQETFMSYIVLLAVGYLLSFVASVLYALITSIM